MFITIAIKKKDNGIKDVDNELLDEDTILYAKWEEVEEKKKETKKTQQPKKDTKKAELYILKLLNSQDEKWVEQAQKIFEQ